MTQAEIEIYLKVKAEFKALEKGIKADALKRLEQLRRVEYTGEWEPVPILAEEYLVTTEIQICPEWILVDIQDEDGGCVFCESIPIEVLWDDAALAAYNQLVEKDVQVTAAQWEETFLKQRAANKKEQ